MSPEIGRIILLLGIVLVVIGGLAVMGVKVPGDIYIQGDNGAIYIPLGTMLIISLILTLVFNFFLRR